MRRLAMKERIRRRQLMVWGGACLLMVGGVAWFSFLPSTLSYWVGTSLAIPFVFLLGNRATDKGFTPSDADHYNDGPWGGP